MENPNIDPRVAPHALSFTSSIDFFFCGFQCQSYDFKTIYETIIPLALVGCEMVGGQ